MYAIQIRISPESEMPNYNVCDAILLLPLKLVGTKSWFAPSHLSVIENTTGIMH